MATRGPRTPPSILLFSSRRRHTRWPRDLEFRRVLFRSVCTEPPTAPSFVAVLPHFGASRMSDRPCGFWTCHCARDTYACSPKRVDPQAAALGLHPMSGEQFTRSMLAREVDAGSGDGRGGVHRVASS